MGVDRRDPRPALDAPKTNASLHRRMAAMIAHQFAADVAEAPRIRQRIIAPYASMNNYATSVAVFDFDA